MVKIKNFLLSLVAITFLTLAACGGSGGDPPTPEEQRLIDLAGSASGITWIATSVTFEGSPSTDFDGMSITLRTAGTGNTYSATNGDPVFGSSGTWGLNGTNISQLLFDNNSDNVFVVTNLNTTSSPATVTLTVNFTDPGGTIEGTNGTYVFNLEHN